MKPLTLESAREMIARLVAENGQLHMENASLTKSYREHISEIERLKSADRIAPESLAVGERGERQRQAELEHCTWPIGDCILPCSRNAKSAPAVGEQTVPALTSKEAADFAEFLDNAFVYLANHGWTTPVPEVIRGMQYLRALASAPEAAGQE